MAEATRWQVFLKEFEESLQKTWKSSFNKAEEDELLEEDDEFSVEAIYNRMYPSKGGNAYGQQQQQSGGQQDHHQISALQVFDQMPSVACTLNPVTSTVSVGSLDGKEGSYVLEGNESVATLIDPTPCKIEQLQRAFTELESHSAESLNLKWKKPEEHFHGLEHSLKKRFNELEDQENEGCQLFDEMFERNIVSCISLHTEYKNSGFQDVILELNWKEEFSEHYEVCAEEKQAVHLLSSAFFHTDNIDGNLHPRIGEEYQAEIPSLRAESQRMFVVSRQQELLSHLLPRIPLEIHKSLLEVTKSFNEKRTSLKDFVFSLKSMVGMELLVEAVGIGNRKQDLIGTALDPCKSNQVISTLLEIPRIGRTCLSLTVGDIVKFLTGGFRLSKARTSELCWEAVWSRLLARGWHSEQPKNLSSVASKNGQVYIVPGNKKFSREKLKKSNHYFGSVSNVLQRVASDPSLLELEADGKDNNSGSDEYGQDVDSILNTNVSFEDKHNCYLLPKLPSCNSELVKITVLDTSIVQGKGPIEVRKLQSLHVCAVYSQISSTCLEETDSNSLEKQSYSDISPNNQGKFNEGASRVSKYINRKNSAIDKGRLSDGLLSDLKRTCARHGQYYKDKDCELLDKKQVVRDSKHQFNRRSKTDQPLESKRRRLIACSTVETGRSSHVFSSYQFKKEDSRVGFLLAQQKKSMEEKVQVEFIEIALCAVNGEFLFVVHGVAEGIIGTLSQWLVWRNHFAKRILDQMLVVALDGPSSSISIKDDDEFCLFEEVKNSGFTPGSIKFFVALHDCIRESQDAMGEASSDAELHKSAHERAKVVGHFLSVASLQLYDAPLLIKKLRAMIQYTEENVIARKKKSALLLQLVTKTVPKQMHCLSLQLSVDSFNHDLDRKRILDIRELEDPSLYHYAIFSNKILATSVVINSVCFTKGQPQSGSGSAHKLSGGMIGRIGVLCKTSISDQSKIFDRGRCIKLAYRI